MQGEITADLAAMPLANMALLFGGIAALLVVVAVVAVFVVRKLGIGGIGPIKMEHRGQSTEHYMNEAIRQEDENCRKQMRHVTNSIKIKISNIFAEMDICVIARVAISTAIRFPLYESVANNHFTTELTLHYDAYRERMIEMMRDEYVSLSSVSKGTQCGRDALPGWDQVSDRLIGCIDLWLRRICREVLIACERKGAIYNKHLPAFKAARDDYRAGFTAECVSKNERYAAMLKTRV